MVVKTNNMSITSLFKPNLLAIVPPYTVWGPPAGSAALLAYLKASGCYDFGFLDLRLFAPDVITPTYRSIGAFGESYALDIPDLPFLLCFLCVLGIPWDGQIPLILLKL